MKIKSTFTIEVAAETKERPTIPTSPELEKKITLK